MDKKPPILGPLFLQHWEWLRKTFYLSTLDSLVCAWRMKNWHINRKNLSNKKRHKLMKTKKIFLNQFLTPPFCSRYEKNHLFISDRSQKKTHPVVSKPMIVVRKCIKSKNQRIIYKSLGKFLETINQMKNSQTEISPSSKCANSIEP